MANYNAKSNPNETRKMVKNPLIKELEGLFGDRLFPIEDGARYAVLSGDQVEYEDGTTKPLFVGIDISVKQWNATKTIPAFDYEAARAKWVAKRAEAEAKRLERAAAAEAKKAKDIEKRAKKAAETAAE